jgi:hypothetical protein
LSLRRRTTLAGARLALLGALLTACNGFVGEWTVLDGFSSRFAAVQNGQSREQVVGSLGTPARESTAFALPQRKGYESLFEQAVQSHPSTFLYWDTAVGEVAVVGLGDDGRVIFKCRAGT